GYFLVMSTIALAIGLVVGNVLHPGAGLHLSDAAKAAGAKVAGGAATNVVDFILNIIPTSLLSSLTAGSVLQTLLVALLVGFALPSLGTSGQVILRGMEHVQRLVFRIMAMIMWLAPVGAFGAMAAFTGAAGWKGLAGLAQIMIGFYATCLIFVVVIL